MEQTEGRVILNICYSAGPRNTTVLSLKNFRSDKEQAHRINTILKTEISRAA
jgi:hypothetical protein